MNRILSMGSRLFFSADSFRPEKNRMPPKEGTVARIVARDGRQQIVRIGPKPRRFSDLYHRFLTVSWRSFLAGMTLAYFAINSLFATLYLLQDHSIGGARPGSVGDAFFFSVETLATIGYGQMYPQTLYANILMAVESLLGMLGLAIAAGLVFARVSRPTAKVLFSEVAVIVPWNGIPTLMFRAANQRRNQILEANVQMTVARAESTLEGASIRRIHDLKLARSHSSLFALTWTIMHPVTEESPLHGATPESLEEADIELIVVLTGIDETFSQTIHARHSYIAAEIRWNERFADILTTAEDGRRIIDYSRFHETIPLQPPGSKATT
jgi:inward rectifier potassium channel